MTKREILDQIAVLRSSLSVGVATLTDLYQAVSGLPDGNTPPPTPDPAPATWTYQVVADKSIACYVKERNAAGKPIMVQIPTDERTGQPFKNLTGQTVKVLRGKIDADGSVDYYQVSGVRRVGTGQPLFLPADKGRIV